MVTISASQQHFGFCEQVSFLWLGSRCFGLGFHCVIRLSVLYRNFIFCLRCQLLYRVHLYVLYKFENRFFSIFPLCMDL